MKQEFFKEVNQAIRIEIPIYIGFRSQGEARYQDYRVGAISADSTEDARVQLVELLRSVADEIERGNGQ